MRLGEERDTAIEIYQSPRGISRCICVSRPLSLAIVGYLRYSAFHLSFFVSVVLKGGGVKQIPGVETVVHTHAILLGTNRLHIANFWQTTYLHKFQAIEYFDILRALGCRCPTFLELSNHPPHHPPSSYELCEAQDLLRSRCIQVRRWSW